jgi:transposase-like protein
MAERKKKWRWFECKARRAYWSVHIEAWLRSGVTHTEYCRAHRLTRRTMLRWIKALDTPLPKRRRAEKKPAKVKYTRLPWLRTRAFTAFWMMHVEALRGSGLKATEYAAAHRLPPRRLRRMRGEFERTPPAQDWRELMHPRGRPGGPFRAPPRYELRYGGSTSAAAPTSPAPPCAASAGSPRRRQFTDKQKLAIVAETTEPGVTVSSVAHRHQVIPAMVFRWRSEFGFAPKEKELPLLVTARVIERPTRGRPKKHNAALVLADLLPIPPGAITVELADGRRVFAPAGSDPEQVREYIATRESNP